MQLLRSGATYKEWRLQIFRRDGFVCTECGCKSSRKNPIELDHIKPTSERPDLIMDADNARTLCRRCHKDTPTYGWKQAKRMRDLERLSAN